MTPIFHKISVILPVFNRGYIVTRAIQSVLNQNYPRFELIIINDGSTDDTKKILEGIIDKRVISIHLEDNRGVNHARNRGIQNATGEFLTFLDSDDWLGLNAFSFINDTINENPDFKHYLFSVDYRFNNNYSDEIVYYRDWIRGEYKGDFLHVVKTKIMKQYPFFEKFISAEYLNWYRVFRKTEPQLYINNVVKYVDLSSYDSISGNIYDKKFINKLLKHLIFISYNFFGILKYRPIKFLPGHSKF